MNELKKTPRDLKTQANKQLILEKAMELFKTNGYEQTTMADITKATGLSNGSVYHLFSSKSQILIEIYIFAFKDELGLNDDIGAKLKDPVYHIKQFLLRYEKMWSDAGWYLADNIYRISRKESMSKVDYISASEWSSTHRNELSRFITTAQEKGALPKKKEPVFLANCIFLFGRGLLYEWSTSQGCYDLVADSEEYWDVMLPSILL